MAIENVSFRAGSMLPKVNNSKTDMKTGKVQEQQADSAEISSKKEKKEVSKAKRWAVFAGALLLAGGLGALTHKFITTRPSHVKKQMADTLGRPLTADEIAKVEKKCKKNYTGWDFLDDILTGLIFI